MYSQLTDLQLHPFNIKKLLVQRSHGLHRACNVHTTENCMYEVLYMSRSYIVFARHLQGVYLNWPLTIYVIMQFINEEQK